VHLDEDRLAAAARALLLIDPSFDPETFLQAECYRDRAMIDRLRKDLGKVAAKLTQPAASVVPIRRHSGPADRPGRDGINCP
jgi:hypothetical protein